MAKEITFEGEVPERFDLNQLISEVNAVRPEVEVEFVEDRTETVKDDPINPEFKYHKAKLIFKNVPDQITRAQVRKFIANHSAAETPNERAKRERGEKLLSVLQELTPEQRQVLKNYLRGL